jgi:hypothetical protein
MDIIAAHADGQVGLATVQTCAATQCKRTWQYPNDTKTIVPGPNDTCATNSDKLINQAIRKSRLISFYENREYTINAYQFR